MDTKLIELFLLVFTYIRWSIKLLGDFLGPISAGVLAMIISMATVIVSHYV